MEEETKDLFKKGALGFGVCLLLGFIIISAIAIFSKDPLTINTETQSYLTPIKTTPLNQITWDDVRLRDDTIYNEDGSCVAEHNGMRVFIPQCEAKTMSGKNIQQEAIFTSNRTEGTTYIFVYLGQLENAKLYLYRNYSHTWVEQEIQDQWVSNYLVDRIVNYTDLGTPNEQCQIGSNHNSKMYLVKRLNEPEKVYCFTTINPINSTAFRITGNNSVGVNHQVTGFKFDYDDISNLVSDITDTIPSQMKKNFTFYKIDDVAPGTYKVKWVFTPQSQSKNGKFHILAYPSTKGIVQSYNQGDYMYQDPSWTASFNVGLKSYWKLNESSGTTSFDSLGRYNLSVTSGQLNKAGMIGTGYTSGGNSGQYINFVDQGKTATWNTWVKRTGTWSSTGMLFGNQDSAPSGGCWYAQVGADVMDVWCGGDLACSFPGGGDIPFLLNSYQMLTIKTNETGIYVYKNGTLMYSGLDASWTNCADGQSFLASYSPFQHMTNADVDEASYWNRSLSDSEVFDLYNSHLALTYVPSMVGQLTITQDTPNGFIQINNTPNLRCNFTSVDQNITNVILAVYNSSNYLSYSNQTSSLATQSFNASWITSPLGQDTYNWACYGFGSIGINASTSNRTFTIHSGSPLLTLNSNITNLTTLSLPINVSLNYTATDPFLSNCWYNTSENATSRNFTCNQTQTITFLTGGSKTINYFANDTAGNQNSSSIGFYIYYIIPSATANNPISEGGLSSHVLTLSMANITDWSVSAWLYWNNTFKGYGTQTNLSANAMQFDLSFIVPILNSSTNLTNWTWYYNITGNPNVVNWNVSGNQTIVPLAISECASGLQKIVNYTLYDEKTRVVSPGTNATIEVDLILTSNQDSSISQTFFGKKQNVPSYLICLPAGALNTTSYRLDSIAKYDYDSHVVEYHYIVNYNLTNTTAPQVIKLNDLLTTESTSFLITYQDENYLYVQDAVVDIWRYYVSESEFSSVEHGKTDAGGQTRAHLVTEDVIYKALIWKDGELLYTSPEFIALCQATPCQINFRKSQSTNESFSNYGNIVYSFAPNKTSRTATLSFATTDGTSTTMNMTIVRANGYENETIYSNSLTSSGGSFTASIPLSYGNDSYKVYVYRDNEYFGQTTLNLKTSSRDIFGQTGIVLSAFAFLILALMGITSGIAVIVLGIVGIALMGMVQIFESGSVFGIGSAIVWLIVAGAILIWKITGRRIS